VSLHIGQWTNLAQGSAIHLYVVEVKPMEGGLVTVDAAALAGDITQTGHSAVYGIYFDTGKAESSRNPTPRSARSPSCSSRTPRSNSWSWDTRTTWAPGVQHGSLQAPRRAVVQVLTAKFAIAAARLSAQGAGPWPPSPRTRPKKAAPRTAASSWCSSREEAPAETLKNHPEPRMNADKRRWTRSLLIGVYLRSSAARYSCRSRLTSSRTRPLLEPPQFLRVRRVDADQRGEARDLLQPREIHSS